VTKNLLRAHTDSKGRSTMATVHDIVQVGVGMPDRERFENFARDMLGFPVNRSADGKVTYVKPDQYQHRIAARTATDPLLRYVGFDVGGPQELADWETELTAKGIDWRHSTPEECVERHLTDFIELKDPDGHPLALSYGFEVEKEPVHYTRQLNVLRLGHVLLTVEDTQRTHDFYTSVLGFRLSDWVIVDDNVRLCFLRCNARHHSMAFAPCMPGKSPRLQHIMPEVESLDDVMRSYHFLRIRKAPIGMGPGRHVNCQTVHVYVQTPGGFAVEFGWGHRRLDDATHQPVVYPPGSPIDVWGGDIQSPEFELG
jgi:2,3-dihydroxy-p-cumate/2,3-dihydroxybenzoate 3,4-dioxygenase